MTIRVAITGFGRIGRNVLRAHYEGGKKHDVEIVAINAPGDLAIHAHLLKHDSCHGRFNADVQVEGTDTLIVNGDRIRVFATRDPKEIPWGELNVDVVMECTGAFNSKEKSMVHIEQGAKKVLLSAPGKTADATVVYGVNQEVLKASDLVVSNASCTTNCLAPMAKGLNDFAPIVSGIMTTIHAWTGDQMPLDGPQRKGNKRRSRACAVNIVPNTTGAAKAIGLVLPELNGKLIGAAQRVPTPTGSITNLYAVVDKKVTVDEVNAAMKAYAATISETFGYNEDDIVSTDIIGETHGSIFDATQTMCSDLGNGQTLVQVTSWYDNENSYTSQMVRTIKYFEKFVA